MLCALRRVRRREEIEAEGDMRQKEKREETKQKGREEHTSLYQCQVTLEIPLFQ